MMQSFLEQILLTEKNNILKTNNTQYTGISTQQLEHSKMSMGNAPYEQFTSQCTWTVIPDYCNYCFKNVLYIEIAN
jgi:hypothetical protein